MAVSPMNGYGEVGESVIGECRFDRREVTKTEGGSW